MPASTPDPDEPDPNIAAILWSLWTAACEVPPSPWSLARLAKQTELAMSTLRRDLSVLEEAALVHVEVDDKGRDCAQLTQAGRALCAQALGSPGPDQRAAGEPASLPTTSSAPSISGDHG